MFSASQVITNGPLRVQFELTYDSIWVDDALYSETQRVTLDAGSNLNRIDITYQGGDVDETLVIACGLVDRPGATARSDTSECWLSLWGATTTDTTNGYLGTGIVVPSSTFSGLVEDSLHYLILGKTEPGTPFTYYAGAGWTRSGDFRTSEDWAAYLSRYSRSIRSPLRLTVLRETK